MGDKGNRIEKDMHDMQDGGKEVMLHFALIRSIVGCYFSVKYPAYPAHPFLSCYFVLSQAPRGRVREKIWASSHHHTAVSVCKRWSSFGIVSASAQAAVPSLHQMSGPMT